MFSAPVYLQAAIGIYIIVSLSRLPFAGHAASLSTTSTSLIHVTLKYENFQEQRRRS